jgi:UDP-N-acetyl-D-mannosaminuronate dehydrogenase
MKKVGILGYGEIGSSVEKCYLGKDFKVSIKDLDRDDGFNDIDILNICIPFFDKDSFVKIVCDHVSEFDPKLTIIHSTVIPETTKLINSKLPDNYVVHSPVRGVHPNLLAGLKTFVKYIGADCKESAKLCKDHYDELGLKSEVFKSSVNSELAKILSTTYYGVCIAFHAEMNKLCENFEANFDEVCTKWNETYNEGYTKLGMSNVVRPVLYPPGEKIGGHCVVPNAELVKTFFKSEALDLILKYK